MAKPGPANRPHTQGGIPCWCGYTGMGIFKDKKPTFQSRAEQEFDAKGLYGR